MSFLLAFGIYEIQSGVGQPEVLSRFASERSNGLSSSVKKVIA